MFSAWKRWWNDPERRLRKRARRTLDELFTKHPEQLQGTSLRPKHRGRTQVLDVADDPNRVFFGILRHPRPHAFSKQYHEVVEIWCYWVEEGRVERMKGDNLSVKKGGDGEPSSFGTGV